MIDFHKPAPPGFEFVLSQHDSCQTNHLAVVATIKDCLPLILEDLSNNDMSGPKYSPQYDGRNWNIPLCDWYYRIDAVPVQKPIKVMEITENNLFFPGDIKPTDLIPFLDQVESILGACVDNLLVVQEDGEIIYQAEFHPPLKKRYRQVVKTLEEQGLIL